MDNIRGGFFIVSNVLDVRVQLPVEITPKLRLAKADDAQISAIQSWLTAMSPGFVNPRSYYEKHWTTTVHSKTSSSTSPSPLERKDWRYYILSFAGYGNETYDLFRAANLVEPGLNAFAQIYTTKEFGAGTVTGWGGDSVQALTAYEAPQSQILQTFDEAAVAELISCHRCLLGLDKSKHPGIERSVEVLQRLKRISRGTDLRVLGLFAILEMLLTHNPNDKEIGDSLSHQISTKVPLLSARFSSPLDYGCFEVGVTETTIWKRLYEYRSKIAHGELAEINGRLSVLRSREVATAFLEQAVRRVVRHALNEPALVDALKPI